MAYNVQEGWGSDFSTSVSQSDYTSQDTVGRIMTVVCDTVDEANDEAAVRSQLPEVTTSHPRLGEGTQIIKQ